MPRESITYCRWNDGGIVRQVEVRQQDKAGAVAYIEADNRDELGAQRQNIRSAIRLEGWGTLSDHRDGKYVLRVTGLRDGWQLIDMLAREGFITSKPEITTSEVKPPKSKNAWDFIKNHSLTISGSIATVGNVMGIGQGVHRSIGNKLDVGQIGKGSFFMLGDLPLMIAGERDDTRQLNDLLRHLKKHYEKEGIEIPQTSSILVETSDRGKSFGELAMDYLHRYANQIKCFMEVVAAGSSILAGKKQENKWKEYAPYVWGSGFAASGLIAEKKIDPEKYAAAGPIQRLWMRIQANPLAIGGALGYTNNFADYMGARMKRREWIAGGKVGPQFYRWDIATPTVMLGANGTYAISKKTVGGDIRQQGIVSDVYSIAAQILNKQPAELREQAMESTAQFLGERPEIRDDHAQILIRLREEMEIQRTNPWFEKIGLPPYVPHHDPVAAEAAAAPDANAATPATIVQASGAQRSAQSPQATPQLH